MPVAEYPQEVEGRPRALPAARPAVQTRATARLSGLDGLRAIAVAAVVLFHADFYWARGGWTMVDLFFVISGYIFAHVYLAGERLREPGGLRAFWVARMARLYPLHLVMLIVCAALFWENPANTVPGFLAHLAMLQGMAHEWSKAFNGPAWSISIEMACYALFALAALGGRQTALKIALLAALYGFALLVIDGRPGGPWSNVDMARGLAGFFLGQVLWLARRRLERIPAWLLAATGVAGLALGTASALPLPPLTLLAWPALTLLALRLPLLETAPLKWLGDRSYAIYLIHEPVIDLVRDRWGYLPGDGATVVAAHVLLAAAVLALVVLALRLIERPARRAIRAGWERPRDARAIAPA
jgi:peptidoglycan/LPS O-acetylase OafA/YrhL